MLAADLTAVAKHRRTEAAKLTSSIRGDLDWIVMKALEKDRTRRYDTAKVSMTGFGVPIATVTWMRTLVIGEDNDEKLMKLNEFALVVVVAKVPRLAAPEKSAMLYRSVAKIPAPEITTHTKVLEGCIADLTGSSNLARL